MGAGSSVSADKYKGHDFSEATVVTVKPKSLDPAVSEDEKVASGNITVVGRAETTSSQHEADEEPKRFDSGSRSVGQGPANQGLEEERDSQATTAEEAFTGTGEGRRAEPWEGSQRAPGGVHLASGTASASLKGSTKTSPGDGGGLKIGQTVWVSGLRSSVELNDLEALIVRWDPTSSRWVVRFAATGVEKRIRAANLSAAAPHRETEPVLQSSGSKELETYMLQSNWSAIYQLFYERFGVEGLNRLERGYAVKAAVEMTLSIVSKCFALLRSDPHGRLHCTPLHIAALQSSVEAAEVIIRDSPQLVARTHKTSPAALCPLHIAILCGSNAIAELLLDGKANPNVRTLHDVTPLHLAATTSKELCQLLLAYSAEPAQHDVMGSNALHYAVNFKQHEVLEVLTATPQAARLAAEGDQKRVTPLHLSCALYAGTADLALPMRLLALGVKPWQADVSGSSSRDVVPYVSNSDLMKFFESCGDNSKAAAQSWLEDFLLDRGDQASDNDGDLWEEGETPTASNTFEAFSGRPTPTGAGRGEEKGAEMKALTEEMERLKAALEASQKRCAELEPLSRQLQHSQEKVEMLEQAARNQQQVFQAQMELMDNVRSQHQVQLQEMRDRQSAERQLFEERGKAEAEVRIREVQHEASSKLRESELRLAELQAQLQEAARAAQEAQAEASQRLTKTLTSPDLAEEAQSDARVEDLQAELGRLEEVCQQERAASAEASRTFQELRSAARTLCAKHGIAWREEAEGPSILDAVDKELSRLQIAGRDQEHGHQALQQQLVQLQDEVGFLRAAKREAEARCKQLEVEVQQAENTVNAKALQLESQLKDNELQQMQAIDQARGDAELNLRRAESAEAQASAMQASVDSLSTQLTQLEARFMEEQLIRKKYHNQIQDMKGTIRVFCRFRPLGKREVENGDVPVLHKADAFSVDLQRLEKHNDTRRFDFDSVFASDSSQEEVFGDCQDLIQSAVDGYNVTIFAYGQTGAGKTHTMYGSNDNPGLAPRAIESLFRVIRREEGQGRKSFSVKAYMIERPVRKQLVGAWLYKQDIIDLLVDARPKDQKSLQVKKDAGRGIMFVEGVSERQIASPEQLKAVLAEGERRRHTAATAMNSSSSRSHLLLSIIVEATAKDTDQVIYGKITLCDLAGSERPKKSEVSGEALKEAIEINKSLTALGDVIEALSKGNKTIPYRNHKLTMLMQDSLGGSAKTLMFVNCSPASSNTEETMMSLKWATRAKQVTNDVKRNADSKEVARLKQVIALMSQAQNVEEPATNAKDSAAGMVS